MVNRACWTALLVITSAVMAGCGTVTGSAAPAPLSSVLATATVAATSSAVSPSSSTPPSTSAAVVSSTAAEDVFQCPTDWEMMEATGLDAWLMSSSMVDGSKGCRYPIADESRYTGAAIEIYSPYVEERQPLSVSQARANLMDIRDSYVEPENADSEADVPFDIVDRPDLGDGAFSVPSRLPDGHACGVFIPIADNKTSFVYVDNGEDHEDLKIPDPELACRAALAVAALLQN